MKLAVSLIYFIRLKRLQTFRFLIQLLELKLLIDFLIISKTQLKFIPIIVLMKLKKLTIILLLIMIFQLKQ